MVLPTHFLSHDPIYRQLIMPETSLLCGFCAFAVPGELVVLPTRDGWMKVFLRGPTAQQSIMADLHVAAREVTFMTRSS